jgi:hypothetical protein
MMVRQAVRPWKQVLAAVPLLLWVVMRLQEQLPCSRQQTTAAHQQQQQQQVLMAAARMALV